MGYAGYERYSEGIAHGKSQVKYICIFVSTRQSAIARGSITASARYAVYLLYEHKSTNTDAS